MLAGLAVLISFGAGAITQVSTMRWPLRRLLAWGIPVLVVGLAVVVSAAWVQPPSLLLFLVGATLAGVGSGPIYRSTMTVVITSAPGDERAGALALFFVVGYVGLSLPVVGVGIALLYVSFKIVLLVLALAVAVGILLATPVLLRLKPVARRRECELTDGARWSVEPRAGGLGVQGGARSPWCHPLVPTR